MVTFNFKDLDRVIKNLSEFERQIPFAMATALNKSADVAREGLSQVWAERIHARNPGFLKAALTRKGSSANKRSLRVTLYDQFGRGNLALHDKGGMAYGRGALAIPTTTSGITAMRGPKGVPKGLRPRNLANSFAKRGKSGDLVIYQRTGRYKKATAIVHKKAEKAGEKRPKGTDNRHLKLEYVTKQGNRVKPDVPFHREFERIMRREVPKQFETAIHSAMKTSFRAK